MVGEPETPETPPSDSPAIWDQLTRSLTEDLATAEHADIARWVSQEPYRQLFVACVQRAWQDADPEASVDVRAALHTSLARLGLTAMDRADRSNSKINDNRVHDTIARIRREQFFGRPALRRVAISGIIAIGMAIAVWTHHEGGFVWTRRAASHTYTTTTGQQAIVTLTDGSTVTLAPRTRLIVASTFGTQARTLVLDGQGYFSVATSSGTPFIVHAGAVGVRVLGTTFDVRHYAGESAVEIAVIHGKVAATSPRARATLVAGALGRVTDSTVTTAISPDIMRHTEWTQGRLVFERTPVPVMLAALSRWYGYDFRLADSSIAQGSVRAEFRTSRPDEAMAMLKEVLNVTLTFDGRIVTLHSRHGAPSAPARNTPTLLPNFTEVGK